MAFSCCKRDFGKCSFLAERVCLRRSRHTHGEQRDVSLKSVLVVNCGWRSRESVGTASAQSAAAESHAPPVLTESCFRSLLRQLPTEGGSVRVCWDTGCARTAFPVQVRALRSRPPRLLLRFPAPCTGNGASASLQMNRSGVRVVLISGSSARAVSS